MDSRLLSRLADPACYSGPVERVEIRQTHLSIVCLAGEFAYKLKKAVRFPFADFSTRELRRHFCEEEVRLNRRLCPDVYLDVVPLLRTEDGSWTFCPENGGGEVEDWAVRMRRLPEELLMQRLLAEKRVTKAQIRDVARIMARFHGSGVASPEALEAGSPAKKKEAILANFDLLETCKGKGMDFDTGLVEAIHRRALADLGRWTPLMEDRARRGRVVDGHGDLHARNICLTDPPAIFDCIEFRPQFRCGDVAMENAFLVMDLTYRGHPDLARIYLDTYIQASGDEEQRQLIPLGVSYRAMVRAKVAALAGIDPDVPDEDRKQARISLMRHLQLAAAGALGAGRVLVLVCGLPGTGKSYFCQTLAERFGWAVAASDRIRKELAGVPPGQRLSLEYYGEEFSRRTYAELIRRACDALPISPGIADANFPNASARAQAAAACREAGGLPCVVWVDAEESVVASRMGVREGETGSVSDANWKIYQQLRASFEPPAGAEGLPVLRIDGGADVDANVNRVLTWLLR